MKFFKEEALRVRAREKIKLVLTKSLARYRKGMKRKGHDQFERNLNHIRNIFTAQAVILRKSL